MSEPVLMPLSSLCRNQIVFVLLLDLFGPCAQFLLPTAWLLIHWDRKIRRKVEGLFHLISVPYPLETGSSVSSDHGMCTLLISLREVGDLLFINTDSLPLARNTKLKKRRKKGIQGFREHTWKRSLMILCKTCLNDLHWRSLIHGMNEWGKQGNFCWFEIQGGGVVNYWFRSCFPLCYVFVSICLFARMTILKNKNNLIKNP